MPKLVANLTLEFEASPMIYIGGEEGDVEHLKGKQLTSALKGSEPSDFTIRIVFLDPEEGWASVGFEMSCKKGVFEWDIDEKNGVAKVKADGEFTSKPLRSGVAPLIQKAGKKADFRLDSFNFKEGEWKGFRAPRVGQVEDECKGWYEITAWSLK